MGDWVFFAYIFFLNCFVTYFEWDFYELANGMNSDKAASAIRSKHSVTEQ